MINITFKKVKDSPEDVKWGAIAFFVCFVFGCIATVTYTWAINKVWDWFFYPILHVHSPGYRFIVGVLLVLSFLKAEVPKPGKGLVPDGMTKADYFKEYISNFISFALFGPFIFVFMAWIWNLVLR